MATDVRARLKALRMRCRYGFHRTVRGLHFTNTLVMLTLAWLLVVVPTGLLMQLFRQTRLDRQGNPRSGVNRHWRDQPLGPDDMKRPF